MGITGLLPFLKKIQRDVHLSSFRGRKVAVDAYSWLHKGSYACALQLVMKSDKLENLPFIKYCVRRVNLLKQHDIQPIMVFDGGYLPTKSATEKDRRERRETYKQKGRALLKEGKKSEAVDCFQKCVDVTPEMALAVIKECRSMGVECIVAPYEADAQLAFLEKVSIVDLVITEDSDLLAFGCKRVLFKLDECGNGKLIELQEIGKANDTLVGFNPDSFRQMCILSGCDYLPSVPGVGLARASKLMKKFNQDPYRVIKSLQFETGKVPEGYEEAFRKAEHTFLYQMVFDPRTQTQVRLNELPQDLDLKQGLEFAGVESSPRKAVGMARGNVNPLTQEVMDTYSPSKAPPPKSTGWNASAMGTSKKPYPVVGQVTIMNFVSSTKSKASFKPPKKVEVEDRSLNDDQLQALYGGSRNENLDDSSDDENESTRLSQATIQPNVITVSRYFAKPVGTTSTPTLSLSRSSLFSKRASCPKLSSNSEEPSALQMLHCTVMSTSPQSIPYQTEDNAVLSLDRHLDEWEEESCSVPESPVEACSTAGAQSLPNPSSRLHVLPAKKRLSFVLKDSCDTSHDTLCDMSCDKSHDKPCDKSHDTLCDKSHVFAKRLKVVEVLDDKMVNPSTREGAENTDPDDQSRMSQDSTQVYPKSDSSVPLGLEEDTHKTTGQVFSGDSCDLVDTQPTSGPSPFTGGLAHSQICDGGGGGQVTSEPSENLMECSTVSRHYVQSADMITTFERAAVTSTWEIPMESEHLVDLTNENSVCLVKDSIPTSFIAYLEYWHELQYKTDHSTNVKLNHNMVLLTTCSVETSKSGLGSKQPVGMRIGLNRGRSKSKFNPPKAPNTGLKQSTLAGLAKFQYTGKPPRMSI